MKKISAQIFLLLAFGASAFAQVTLSISPNPKMMTVPNPPIATDVIAHAKVKNLVNETRTYKWTRTTVNISTDCKTQICDRNNCYLASVSTKQFTMTPLEDSTMDVHLVGFDPNGGPALLCCAVIHIKIEEVSNPDNTVTGIYIFDGCTSGTLSAGTSAARLFPNPTNASFSLENADNVALIRVFSMDGRELKTFEALPPGGIYPIAELQNGTYILVLQNQQGATLSALELVKK